MTPQTDWERWGQRWLAIEPDADLRAALVAGAERERRHLLRTWLAELLVAASAVSIIGAALIHAHSPTDLMLAAVIVATILVVALVELSARRDPVEAEGEPTEVYVELWRARCAQQLRGVRVAWILIALDLAFLVPWWIDGYHVHGWSPMRAIAIATGWIPLAAMTAVVSWTLLVRRRVLVELRRLDTLRGTSAGQD